jgi:hypothetical protein
MQFARAKSDRLILAPSISLSPLFSVTVPLYDPARSIRDSLPVSVSTLMDFILDFLEMLIWKTAWLLELVRLALVDSVVLRLLPAMSRFITCSVDSAWNSVTPAMVMPR